MARQAKPQVYRVEPRNHPKRPRLIEHDENEFADREVSFSSGQRKAVYVLGFLFALASGNGMGFFLAVIVWAIAHAHATVKGRTS